MDSRQSIARQIESRLSTIGIKTLNEQYFNSGKINHIVVDQLLPGPLAHRLSNFFPPETQLKLLDGREEKKYVGVNFSSDQKIIEECIYAFQEPAILKIFASICQIDDLEGDPELYAGGVSSMGHSCFLNPHIDNSHDRLRQRYRRLNLLYYVSKGWQPDHGGQLVLYPNGIQAECVEIDSLFNRLVVMKTDHQSLHGVKRITSAGDHRKTISNYYFSPSTPLGKHYYHSTSFRGFPGERKKDILLRTNALLRTTIKSLTGNLFGTLINTGYHRKNK
jgi:Rps23 Pro-64 3,4-dihydroxylase Tpa1-like proline 4-hydroxylase